MARIGYIYDVQFGWRHDSVGFWLTLVLESENGQGTTKIDASNAFTCPVHGHAIEEERINTLGTATDNMLSLMDEAEVTQISDLLGHHVVVEFENKRPSYLRILSELK